MNYNPGVTEEPTRIQAPPWSDDETSTLKRLWGEGKPASAIGKALNRSRNAVIGRVDRLGLPKRGTSWTRPARPPRPEKPPVLKLKPVKKSVPKPKPYVPAPNEPTPLNLKLWELPDNGCHWAVNDGGPFLFCGHERGGNPTYCQFHTAKATTTQLFWGQK